MLKDKTLLKLLDMYLEHLITLPVLKNNLKSIERRNKR